MLLPLEISSLASHCEGSSAPQLPWQVPWRGSGQGLAFTSFTVSLAFSQRSLPMGIPLEIDIAAPPRLQPPKPPVQGRFSPQAYARLLVNAIQVRDVQEAAALMLTLPLALRPSVACQVIGGETPLALACRHGFPLLVQFLITACGAVPNQALLVRGNLSCEGEEDRFFYGTAMHVAVSQNDPLLVRQLFSQGHPVNLLPIQGSFGSMTMVQPLHLACKLGLFPMVQLLIEMGADVNARGTEGRNSIWYCCSNLHILDYLLALGANINHTDDEGRSLFHHLVTYHKVKEADIACYVARGAKVDIVDVYGLDPFAHALSTNRFKIAAALLSFSPQKKLVYKELTAAFHIYFANRIPGRIKLKESVSLKRKLRMCDPERKPPYRPVGDILHVSEIKKVLDIKVALRSKESANRHCLAIMDRILRQCPVVIQSITHLFRDMEMTHNEEVEIVGYYLSYLNSLMSKPIPFVPLLKTISGVIGDTCVILATMEKNGHAVPVMYHVNFLCMSARFLESTARVFQQDTVFKFLQTLGVESDYLEQLTYCVVEALQRILSEEDGATLPDSEALKIHSAICSLINGYPDILGYDMVAGKLKTLEYLLKVSATMDPAKCPSKVLPHLRLDKNGSTWLHAINLQHFSQDHRKAVVNLFVYHNLHLCTKDVSGLSLRHSLEAQRLIPRPSSPLPLKCIAAQVASGLPKRPEIQSHLEALPGMLKEFLKYH